MSITAAGVIGRLRGRESVDMRRRIATPARSPRTGVTPRDLYSERLAVVALARPAGQPVAPLWQTQSMEELMRQIAGPQPVNEAIFDAAIFYPERAGRDSKITLRGGHAYIDGITLRQIASDLTTVRQQWSLVKAPRVKGVRRREAHRAALQAARSAYLEAMTLMDATTIRFAVPFIRRDTAALEDADLNRGLARLIETVDTGIVRF